MTFPEFHAGDHEQRYFDTVIEQTPLNNPRSLVYGDRVILWSGLLGLTTGVTFGGKLAPPNVYQRFPNWAKLRYQGRNNPLKLRFGSIYTCVFLWDFSVFRDWCRDWHGLGRSFIHRRLGQI